MKIKTSTLFKSIGYVTIGTILGKLSGFIKHYAVVYVFGLSQNADAFFVANIIPEMLVNILLSGLLAGAFIPIAGEVLTKEGTERFKDFISSLFILVGLSSLVLGLILFVAPGPIARLLAPGYHHNELKIVGLLLQYFSPGIVFLGLAAILAGVLQSLEDFRIVSFGLFIYNTMFIVSLLALHAKYQIFSAGIGISCGAFFWFFSLFLFTRGMMKLHPQFEPIKKYIRKTATLALPSLLIIAISNLTLLLEKNFASKFSEGTITELNLAFRMTNLFLTVLILPLSTVLLPRMTKQFSLKQFDKLKITIRNVLQIITGILVLCLIFFIYNALTFTHITYYFLRIDRQNLYLISQYATWYALSFMGLFYYMFFLRVFYSLQKIWEIVKANVIGLVFYVALIQWLIPKFKIYAFPVSYSIYAIVTTIYLAMYLNFKIPFIKGILGKEIIFYLINFIFLFVLIGLKLLFFQDSSSNTNLLFSLISILFYIYLFYKIKKVKSISIKNEKI